MSWLDGLPLPADAPPPRSCVRIERPEPGLARLVLDPPHREHTVIDLPLLRDLDLALDEVLRDGGLRGLVVAGRRPLHFAFGADLDAIEAVREREVVERLVLAGHHVFGRLASAGRVRTVAAVGGPVPGGACELSLACHAIVAADDPSTRIGLPEVRLGIVPAWGGCHRLPRRIGVLPALDAILQGRLYDPRRALRMGLVDRVTPPEHLARVAADVALGRDVRVARRGRGARGLLVDKNPLAMAVVERKARARVLAETGGHYPAPLRALELVVRAPRTGPEAAARREAAAAAELATGAVCKCLISIFRASEEAKKLAQDAQGRRPRPIARAGVVGAGVMGAAIASLMAERGVATRLADLSAEALDAAAHAHRREIERQARRRRLAPHEARGALDRLDLARSIEGFAGAELVVEAVAERLSVKREVFGTLARQLAPDAVLATNTSSLAVGAIAAGLPGPERFVGLHFFNPVRRMPLVEVVRAEATSDEVVRAAAALALRLGKTPIVVRDVAGFLVNRVLGPYLDEALRLFEDGVPAARLDGALEAFGMPMGPLRLLDEVGFDIASHAAAALHEAYGERMQPSGGLAPLLEQGRIGRKSGLGFYQHPRERGAKARPALDLERFQPRRALAALGEAEIADRCLLAMLNEAARCLEEQVVAGPTELDLGTVMGLGFAPFRGGLLRWADTRGAGELVARLEAFAAAPDVAARGAGAERFRPAELLRELARDGRGFHAAGRISGKAVPASR